MLARLVSMMGGIPATPGAVPSINLAGVTEVQPGACTLHDPWIIESAIHRVEWTYVTTPSNTSGYEVRVYRDGGLLGLGSFSAQTVHLDAELTGWVEGADLNQFEHTYAYRIDVVRKNDGSVVSTATRSIATNYGRCH